MTNGKKIKKEIESKISEAQDAEQAKRRESQKSEGEMKQLLSHLENNFQSLALLWKKSANSGKYIPELEEEIKDRKQHRETKLHGLREENKANKIKASKIEGRISGYQNEREQIQDELQTKIQELEIECGKNLKFQQAWEHKEQLTKEAEEASAQTETRKKSNDAIHTKFHLNPIFQNLKRRNYSEESYEENIHQRLIDRFCAKVINYKINLEKFKYIFELDKIQKESENEIKERLDLQHDNVNIILESLKRKVGVQDLEETIDKKDQSINVIQTDLEALHRNILFNQERIAEIETRNDSDTQKIEKLIEKFCRKSTQSNLSKTAKATSEKEDDRICEEIQKYQKQIDETRPVAEKSLQEWKDQNNKLSRLENALRDFKSRGYQSDEFKGSFSQIQEKILNLYTGVLIENAFNNWMSHNKHKPYVSPKRSSSFGGGSSYSSGSFGGGNISSGGSFGGGRISTGGGF